MRYTRASVPEDKRYLASTAVVMSEVAKSLACMIVLYLAPQPHLRSISRLFQMLNRELIVNWRESAKLAFPAILYLIQNNLQYVAATNLDAATFQVTYQLKILTTAFFSVVILHRSLSRTKWIALALLTLGIGLVVLPKDASLAVLSYFNPEKYAENGLGDGSIGNIDGNGNEDEDIGNQSNIEGFTAVLMACVLSGLAGVYFEKILKAPVKPASLVEDEENKVMVNDNDNDRDHDDDDDDDKNKGSRRSSMSVVDDSNSLASQNLLWIRNIQMSFFSVVLGLLFVVLLQDGATIAEKGFYANYTGLTWLVIGIQAFGGLVVAVVVKYADNILKGFATSISIILSSIISVWVFSFSISLSFVMGATLVIYATYLYGL
ncbi:UDP-galactose transporter [Phycomyces blakesleeanus]|uniref:UDP-galactose transporter n=1 Tax=Phycomyces blakesleeanus TaxID=4837 RepID=A0ABR3ASY0_PHYBL